MMKLVLIRHGESEWNKLNLFTGWTDVELSDKGREEAKNAGRILKEEGYDFDVCYTSYLKRAIHTLNIALDEMDRAWLPVIKSWKLNERHYGALQGLNKSETAEKYGEEQVKIWRRSFDVKPPALEESDERSATKQEMFRDVDKALLPANESLETTIERVIPYFNDVIKKDMQAGKRVVIAAHGNSLRALVKYFDNLSSEEIIGVNIPTAVPLVYEFDDNFNVIKHYYLGDQEALKAKMDAVANQGKAK
ncbi:MAG: 2,3-diphosphoglycerate-dependent phosphoglycerate mutase [Lachnospiraceae bacterium]|nr:2,3-diphosphoglycerate-dependent phosphoglycerate mutase [Lachnospiraceae bacterium]